ncbi:MAG TPA: hypothetical protein VGS11_04295 [Candidatus Bathyarchaeia archaeon]|nr:hypothetical protein [Candidatus Bathyarchaeia archaeon]
MNKSFDDTVELSMWSALDCASRDIGRRFLEILLRFGFVPERFGDEDPPKRKFDRLSTAEFLNVWETHPGQLVIEKHGSRGFQALAHLNVNPYVVMPTYLVFYLHDEYFDKESPGNFLLFAEEMYALFKPVHGDIGHYQDRKAKTFTRTPIIMGKVRTYAEGYIPANPTWGLPGIYWANFLGPIFVDFFSKEKIETVPCYSKKRLADGGYLILTSESPLDYSKVETKQLERTLTKYLGEDTVFDKTRPDIVLRSPLPFRGKRPSPPTDKPRIITASGDLKACPDCGEAAKIDETSRDALNKLVSFKCLKCGAIWAVHISLLR